MRVQRVVLDAVRFGALAGGNVVQQGEDRGAFVEEQAHVALGFGCAGQRSFQVGQGLLPVPALLVSEGSQHADLEQAAGSVRVGGGMEPVEQRERVAER